ncbi:NADH-quinone oxidoreductase subunit G [Candidatus Thiodiazotropha endoloripes]|uniref:NADH-quinone oxidoreductase subunit NuoG n=1 Tax=Candidatus Thiodiazotropha endoloripes TaxID=1818881 RepID=UPI00083D1375|nr:NADH-quinone oxidoreductase subunit NuoG [Candidatus Thiodiazotropha endoloripes]MCG7901872.1 NADH-quinone oxidoreductase subunit NuoG [Candidatus Thiodiazotropha weberae]ODB83029.1 NADH-quinone oxidoreductase subunit G [Candidatus Thiodiazotropha endoloripes]ODB83396.1 NADH-quinone oxidoreductase subunit G [Candidatus Thiodiazotropha endoloripes]ODB91025.1 NADH-quinone oxidoreductase subunit G [Candidatus Thiodiazotropha endoloripes]
MTDKLVTIEVNGQELQAEAGIMLIEATDAAGINIPRFCYHKKLSVAANCRMCLVEVEKVPKPLPACATPVSEGMKVYTRSPKALAAQKGTMEFLLINHPLDCPICDQGGECELQDVAIGYGRDVSRYSEGKRVVADKNIGPLIATDMTRCIHCTRCVRFGEEIAGIREMGATGRGEHMVIGTYIEKSVDSELSGNIIDLCPVGALTSKPFRFNARAWELTQVEAIAPHDSLGSNLNLHLRGNKVMRVHPKDNESINETWISDRDRFSYEGLYSSDRLTSPMVKKGGEWKEVSWEMALEMAAASLKEVGDGDQIGTLVSPSSTVEELFLAQKLMRGLGCNNIDSRLRQGDFRMDATQNSVHWLGSSLSDMDQMQTLFVVGGNIRKEQPILAHRLRKAALNGAKLHYLNPIQIDLNHSGEQDICTPGEMAGRLAAVAKAAGVKASDGAASLLGAAKVDASAKQTAANLKAADGAMVMLGAMAQAHPDYALLYTIAVALAEATGAQLSILPASANSVGAQLAGAVPHLQPGGRAADRAGLDALQMLKLPRKGYLLLGVEPGRDFWNGSLSMSALQSADIVVAISAFRSPELEACADIMLPMAIFTETSGTYVNAEGRWQQSRGVVRPQGESRPGWKILRVLGNLTDQPGFDYIDSQQIHDELHQLCESSALDNKQAEPQNLEPQLSADALLRGGDTPLYACDPLVRRATALQQTQDAGSDTIRLHPEEAARLGLEGSDTALVKQNGNQIDLPLQLDERIPQGCVWISTGLERTSTLGQPFGEVTVEKA